MAKLRKFVAYRRKDRLKRAYTRYSRYKKYCYVRARPVCKIARFDLGEPNKKFKNKFHLVTTSTLQIRDNAIESARTSATRLLEKTLGKSGWYLQVRIYPHHILRENPLASGAGADRMSTGMAHNYGKPMGIAAQVHDGQPLLTVHVDNENTQVARQALKRASYKFPCSCSIVAEIA
ncbi:MAG: 50S ribosomal protein L16 [Candidatus Aenigmarchaeota archaeon]|nr:50S ribosomal protein L16 [Candidatus Aenigmarchaeota archaeon]